MDINIAREVAARIWCDQEMSSTVMDVELAEEIAQLLASRLTQRAADGAYCECDKKFRWHLRNGEKICSGCGLPRR